jgi:hypothetical protein
MGTCAPAVREHDIPIVKRPKKPLALPAPDPKRVITPGVPATVPEPEKVERNGT